MEDWKVKRPGKQEAAIKALLSPADRNQTDAAQDIGVSARTLPRWLRLPDFSNELCGDSNPARRLHPAGARSSRKVSFCPSSSHKHRFGSPQLRSTFQPRRTHAKRGAL
jgi:hypothetical protein